LKQLRDESDNRKQYKADFMEVESVASDAGHKLGGSRSKNYWTYEEELALQQGLNKYDKGCKERWRHILEDPGFSDILKNRSNVNIKDKYRQMLNSGAITEDGEPIKGVPFPSVLRGKGAAAVPQAPRDESTPEWIPAPLTTRSSRSRSAAGSGNGGDCDGDGSSGSSGSAKNIIDD